MTYTRFSKELLESIVPTCVSYAEVCRQLGKSPVGGNISYVNKLCRKYDIDCSHMTGQAHATGKQSSRLKSAESRLVLGQPLDFRMKSVVLTRALQSVGVEYKCNLCGIVDWNGRELVLEVDHKNSMYWDNRQENLQFICPNCHAQETNVRREYREYAPVT